MGRKMLTLDIGAANIALAEYDLGRGLPTLVNYGFAPLAAPLDQGDAETILVPAIMDVMREKGIRPGPVMISVSGQMVFPLSASILGTPKSDKFEEAVRFEVEQKVPFPLDQMICDRQVLGETESGEQSVVIVAAKTEQIESITSAVAKAGLVPEAVSAAPIALTSALRAVKGDEGAVVVLDIGAKTTSLVIAEGERLYTRSIPIAGNNITREISQALGVPQDEAESAKTEMGYVATGGVVEDADPTADAISKVCRTIMARLHAEISRSVNFYRSQQGGGEPVKLYLTGGTSLLPQIDQFFAESLGLEVELFNPFEAVGAAPSLDAEELSAAALMLSPTVGLACQAAGTAALAVNLLPPTIIAERAEKAKIPAVAVAGVLLLAGLVLVYLGIGKSGGDLDEKLDEANAEVRKLNNFASEITAVESEVKQAEAHAEAFKKLLDSRYIAINRLNAVRQALTGGMWIESWDGDRVTVRGWKDSLAAVIAEDAKANGGKTRTAGEIFKGRLETREGVDKDGVRILDMKDVGGRKEIDQFTVEVKFI